MYNDLIGKRVNVIISSRAANLLEYTGTLVSENNEDAKELFYNKYKPIIEMKAKKLSKIAQSKGYDYNDLVQEGMIGLTNAINSFSDQKDVQFSTFANLCIERQMFSFIRNISAGRHKILNDSVSFETTNSFGSPLINLFIYPFYLLLTYCYVQEFICIIYFYISIVIIIHCI